MCVSAQVRACECVCVCVCVCARTRACLHALVFFEARALGRCQGVTEWCKGACRPAAGRHRRREQLPTRRMAWRQRLHRLPDKRCRASQNQRAPTLLEGLTQQPLQTCLGSRRGSHRWVTHSCREGVMGNNLPIRCQKRRTAHQPLTLTWENPFYLSPAGRTERRAAPALPQPAAPPLPAAAPG
jgi:hypothetical protein